MNFALTLYLRRLQYSVDPCAPVKRPNKVMLKCLPETTPVKTPGSANTFAIVYCVRRDSSFFAHHHICPTVVLKTAHNYAAALPDSCIMSHEYS